MVLLEKGGVVDWDVKGDLELVDEETVPRYWLA